MYCFCIIYSIILRLLLRNLDILKNSIYYMYRVVVVSWDLYRDMYRIVAVLLPNFTHCGLWPWMAPTVSLNLVNIGLQSLWKSPVRGPRPAKHTSDQLTSFVWSCLKSGKIKPNSGSVGQKPKSFHSDWVWVMAWCLMESNHYMNHCRPASMRSCGIHLCIISPDQMLCIVMSFLVDLAMRV